MALVLLVAPVQGSAADPPGRAVELEVGQPALYRGSLVDAERMAAILAKRRAAELETAALRLGLQDAQAARQAAESRAAARPDWGTAVAVALGALVVGVAGGVALATVGR
jgi:hypothetical protein